MDSRTSDMSQLVTALEMRPVFLLEEIMDRIDAMNPVTTSANEHSLNKVDLSDKPMEKRTFPEQLDQPDRNADSAEELFGDIYAPEQQPDKMGNGSAQELGSMSSNINHQQPHHGEDETQYPGLEELMDVKDHQWRCFIQDCEHLRMLRQQHTQYNNRRGPADVRRHPVDRLEGFQGLRLFA